MRILPARSRAVSVAALRRLMSRIVAAVIAGMGARWAARGGRRPTARRMDQQRLAQQLGADFHDASKTSTVVRPALSTSTSNCVPRTASSAPASSLRAARCR